MQLLNILPVVDSKSRMVEKADDLAIKAEASNNMSLLKESNALKLVLRKTDTEMKTLDEDLQSLLKKHSARFKFGHRGQNSFLYVFLT